VLKRNVPRAFQLQGLIASVYGDLKWHGEGLILVNPVIALPVCNILILGFWKMYLYLWVLMGGGGIFCTALDSGNRNKNYNKEGNTPEIKIILKSILF
jgi:hypothetical protein